MSGAKMIGIVGGVGPHAGLDLARKICDETVAVSDQEHPDVSLVSMPGSVADRTEFLLGHSDKNPAEAILEAITKLAVIGARVVGIPCNSAHAPPIFDPIARAVTARFDSMKLLNMVEEVGSFIREFYPQIQTVGVLATTGTYRLGTYSKMLEQAGLQAILPDEKTQAEVHSAIYNRGYGIKAQSNPATEQAKRTLDAAVAALGGAGAELVILGCTEIPLAITETRAGRTVLVDPARILARALIREAAPDKLRPFLD